MGKTKADTTDLMDKFYEANVMLEMCRGYTQADNPSMTHLEDALNELANRYNDIYLGLICKD